jgi:hypothetical protein
MYRQMWRGIQGRITAFPTAAIRKGVLRKIVLRRIEIEKTGRIETTGIIIIEITEIIGIIEIIEKTEKTGAAGIITIVIIGTIEKTEVMVTRTAREDRIAVSPSREEVMVRMPDSRVTGPMDFRETAGRVLKAVQMIAVVRALIRAADAVITIIPATVEAMEGREADSEIISRVKDLRQKLLPKIWRRSGRKTRGGLTARRRISAPGKIIFMKRIP